MEEGGELKDAIVFRLRRRAVRRTGGRAGGRAGGLAGRRAGGRGRTGRAVHQAISGAGTQAPEVKLAAIRIFIAAIRKASFCILCEEVITLLQQYENVLQQYASLSAMFFAFCVRKSALYYSNTIFHYCNKHLGLQG